MKSVQAAGASNVDLWLVYRMEWLHASKKQLIFIEYSNARDSKDKVLCQKLEKQNLYLQEIYNELGPCKYTEYQHYLKLLMFWLHCVKENERYGNFCDVYIHYGAGSSQILQIAPLGDPIYDFYADWGDVREVEDDLDWIRSKHDLFMPVWVEAFKRGSAVQKSIISVSIPKGFCSADVLNGAFWGIVNSICKKGVIGKYQIKRVQGESLSDTSERLSIASYVSSLFVDEGLSGRNIAEKYLHTWEIFRGMQGAKFRAIPKGNDIKDHIDSSKKKMRMYKISYQNCIAQAISDTFPPST